MLHYNPVETNHIRGGDVFLSAINFFSHEAKLYFFELGHAQIFTKISPPVRLLFFCIFDVN